MGLAGMPLVLEAACRSRVVTLAWSQIRLLVSVNPLVVPQGASSAGPARGGSLGFLTDALPELLKVQPTGIYREVVVTKQSNQKEFVREFGTLIAAPPETDRFRTANLRAALLTKAPVYIEDDEACQGLCCVCGKKGALGRCRRCGLLMHYSCVAPRLPGGPQDCPRCAYEFQEEDRGPALPHEMEVGGPIRKKVRRAKAEPLGERTEDGGWSGSPPVSGIQNTCLDPPAVGVDEGLRAEVPFPILRMPSDDEARQAGYSNAEDWYCKSAAASLAGPVMKHVEYMAMPPPADPEDWDDTVGEGDESSTRRTIGEEFGEFLAPVLELYLSSTLGVERPYLLLDELR